MNPNILQNYLVFIIYYITYCVHYLFESPDAIEFSKFNPFMLKHVPRASAFQIIEEDEFQNFNPKS